MTGPTGWLGRRLVPELLDAGHDVRCLVEPDVDTRSLNRQVAIAVGDVRNRAAVEAAVEGADAVIHCAAVIHPTRASDFWTVNAGGTRHLLEAASRAGVRRLVHVSSNAAAGFQRGRDLLLREEDQPAPRGGYGESKRAAELLVRAAHRDGRLETSILRPCRFYGRGLPSRIERVFEMINSGHVPVFGDGLALRSMTSVDDLAVLLVQCLDDSAAAGETFWVADDIPYTALAGFDAMARAAEVPLRVLRLPLAAARLCEALDLAYQRLGGYSMSLHLAGESRHDVGCSVEKAKRVLGFRPKNDLVGGFREALEQSRASALVAA